MLLQVTIFLFWAESAFRCRSSLFPVVSKDIFLSYNIPTLNNKPGHHKVGFSFKIIIIPYVAFVVLVLISVI